MLTVDNLSLSKDDKKIFSNLGFSVSINSALIIKGCDGYGKTSLLKIIAGIAKTSEEKIEGKILWGGEDVENFRSDFNSDLQFLDRNSFLKPRFTVLENLKFYAKLSDTMEALPAALSFFDLEEFANKKIKNLSANLQQRVMLARLLACPATLWLLDDPSNNLDDEGKEKLHGLIKIRVTQDGLVLVASDDEMFFDLGPSIDLGDYTQSNSNHV